MHERSFSQPPTQGVDFAEFVIPYFQYYTTNFTAQSTSDQVPPDRPGTSMSYPLLAHSPRRRDAGEAMDNFVIIEPTSQ